MSGITKLVAFAATMTAVVASVALVVAATIANNAIRIAAKIDRCRWISTSHLRLYRGRLFGRIVVGIAVITMDVRGTIGGPVVIVVVIVRVPVMMVMYGTSDGHGRNGET